MLAFALLLAVPARAQERVVGAYRFELLPMHQFATGKLRITRGKTILREQDGRGTFSFPSQPPAGDDLGSGNPSVVVNFVSPGRDCCHYAFVFDITDEGAPLLDMIWGDTSEVRWARYEDRWVARVADPNWSFFRGIKPPPVVLAYNRDEKRFAFVEDLMRSAPLASRLTDLAREIKENGAPDDPRLWQAMVDLTYTGNFHWAIAFFDLSGQSADHRRKFEQDFVVKMQQSRYWPDIKKLNRLP